MELALSNIKLPQVKMHEMIYWRVDGQGPNFNQRPLDVNTVNTWVNTVYSMI